MLTSQRLKALRDWAQHYLCEGHRMKAPAQDFNILNVTEVEPRVYLGWFPARPDSTGRMQIDPPNTVPSILIMPCQSNAKYVESQRYDQYNRIRRSQEMGQDLTVQMLFSVYEPGVRLPGFIDSAKDEYGRDIDMDKLMEGTEQGLFTLTNWMDECIRRLLADKTIPGSDLFVRESSVSYSPYMEQNYVADKRPVFYGFITVTFTGYADDGNAVDGTEEAVVQKMLI